MNLRDRIAINIYNYRSETSMAILSLAFGYWLYQKVDLVLFVSSQSVRYLSATLILIGISTIAGIYTKSYAVRKWSSNIAILVWTIFFSISLYTKSDFSVILLALLIDSVLVRASQQIGRKIEFGEF